MYSILLPSTVTKFLRQKICEIKMPVYIHSFGCFNLWLAGPVSCGEAAGDRSACRSSIVCGTHRTSQCHQAISTFPLVEGYLSKPQRLHPKNLNRQKAGKNECTGIENSSFSNSPIPSIEGRNFNQHT